MSPEQNYKHIFNIFENILDSGPPHFIDVYDVYRKDFLLCLFARWQVRHRQSWQSPEKSYILNKKNPQLSMNTVYIKDHNPVTNKIQFFPLLSENTFMTTNLRDRFKLLRSANSDSKH